MRHRYSACIHEEQVAAAARVKVKRAVRRFVAERDHYLALVRGLRDMLGSRRLRADMIPDDYHWLVTTLAEIAKVDREPHEEE